MIKARAAVRMDRIGNFSREEQFEPWASLNQRGSLLIFKIALEALSPPYLGRIKNEMSEDLLELINNELSGAPELLALVQRYRSELTPSVASELLAEIDDSIYTLPQWFEALVAIQAWLDERELSATFHDQIGYISCATAMTGPMVVENSLAEVVGEMLAEYGFERAS